MDGMRKDESFEIMLVGAIAVCKMSPDRFSATTLMIIPRALSEQTFSQITVLLPCLNEAATVGACVSEAVNGFKNFGFLGEVLIADNGSNDGSQNIARALGARVIHVKERGYGNALLAGINAANGEFILMGDSDMSYDFCELPRYLAELRKGADFVMGCRFPSGGGTIHVNAMPFLHRWLGNPVLSALGRLFFKSHIHDFHCGIRAFRKDKILGLNLTTPGMEFATEMVVKAHIADLKIVEVPATLRRDGRNRPPHLRTWQDGWRHLRFMLLYSPNWLFLFPGLGLYASSLVAFLFLSMKPVIVGSVRFDTNTLLASGMGVLVGMQIISLGTFINVYARTHGLLPLDNFYKKLAKCSPFESGLVAGLAFGLTGLFYFATAFLKWKSVGFGDLPYGESLRLIIPSVVLIGMAVQIVFSGFVLAVLGIHRASDDK